MVEDSMVEGSNFRRGTGHATPQYGLITGA